MKLFAQSHQFEKTRNPSYAHSVWLAFAAIPNFIWMLTYGILINGTYRGLKKVGLWFLGLFFAIAIVCTWFVTHAWAGFMGNLQVNDKTPEEYVKEKLLSVFSQLDIPFETADKSADTEDDSKPKTLFH